MTDATFPAELLARPQWVLWRYEVRGGRATKVPYAVTGQRASTTDPATWNDFETVVLAFAASGRRWDGFGFVFAAGDGYCGIDLDHVIDATTGVIDERASSIIETLASYTEYSPSGTGAHVIVRATLPADCRKRHKLVECYDTARYFTVTGRIFPGAPAEIADWDGAALIGLLFGDLPAEQPRVTLRAVPQTGLTFGDRELLDEAAEAANGAQFRALWRGAVGNYSSRSEADSALCFHLAFWTDRDPSRMDRLFRQSGLMREKWDRPMRSGDPQTYGDLTIRRACAIVGEGFGSGRAG